DSSGDLQNTAEYIRVVPDRFSVMIGRDTLIVYGLIAGAKGAVPATGNVAPALVVEIYDRFRAGDLEGAKAAQVRLTPLRLALPRSTTPAGLKAALRLLGLPIGPCRSPVSDLSPELEPKLRAALKSAGLGPGDDPLEGLPQTTAVDHGCV